MIATAAPSIQKEYGFSLVTMGWIFAAFQFAYALFQIPGGWLGDRFGPRRALTGVVEPGGRVIVLALSARGPGFGPQIDDDAVPTAFAAPDWTVESLAETIYRGRVTYPDQARATGAAVGELVDLPAVVARVRRTGP